MGRINAPYDVESVRDDFPILKREVRGKPLVYLDNAATTLKPKVVADAIYDHYLMGASNVHRGVHYLSEEATRLFEGTRNKLKAFLNSHDAKEIIFTTGTTGGINLIAKSFAPMVVKEGDEILVSSMEHHSNIVPWQMLCQKIGCKLRVIPMNERGELILEEYELLLSDKTKIVACSYVSNALGTVNPIKTMTAMARKHGAYFVVDAAQATAHVKIDVQDLDVDFLAISSHKLFGPTGIGALYGRKELLKKTPPLMGGGDMIHSVTFEKSTYADLPALHEAGTPHIAGVIGFGAAIDYLQGIGLDKVHNYEAQLLELGTQILSDIPGVKLIGTAKNKASVLSFTLEGVHPHDIGSLLDMEGIAVRAGHHCAQPVMQYFKVPATTRASLSIYNTEEELHKLGQAIIKVKEMFS